MEQQSPEHTALGRAVREARAACGLSQGELAARSGMHRAYIGGVERGERNASYASLLRIAEALDVPLSELQARAERNGQVA